jgi:membrane protein YfhO
MATPRTAQANPTKKARRTPRPDPVTAIAPRHDYAWAALIFAFCTLALGFPALGGAFLVSPMSDQFIGGYAVRNFAAMSLKAGHGIPLWNPYLFGGLPYVAAMHGDIFYPTFLLRALLPTDIAMTWSFIIHVFLAGFFTFCFLRAWGLRFITSLVGGLTYMMSGPISSYVSPGHDGKLYVSALFPLALWMLLRGIREGTNWTWGVLALTVGLAVLSPHPQLLQYMLLASGAFAMFLAFGHIEHPDGSVSQLERGTAIRRLIFALGSVVVGALIGAIQYLPVTEYVPFSPRAGGRDYAYATSYSFPLEEVINVYLPQFSGILDKYWGRNGIHLHSEYLGAAALLLAGAGLASLRRAFRWFWIGMLIISVLWALGGSTPFYHLIYAVIPGTKFFRAPSTILFIVAFSVAMLAALGAERLVERQVARRYVAGWVITAIVVALLASVGALTSMAQVIASSFAGDQLDELIASNNTAVILGAWRSCLVVLFVSGILWLLLDERITKRVAAWSIVALIAMDFFSVEKQYWMFSPRASVLYASDPAIDYMKAQREPGRALAFPMAQLPNKDVMLEGDGLMVHDVRQALGYHGNEIGRYQLLAGKSATSPYDPRIFLSPAFWRQENVRFLYTNVDSNVIHELTVQLGLPPVTKILGPAMDAQRNQVYLYRLPGENPIAWTATAFVKAADDAALEVVRKTQFDPKRVAIIDTSSRIAAQQIKTLPEPLDIPVHVVSYAPGRIQMQLASPAPANAALVVSENYFTGWHATADGRPVVVDRADYNLIGVQLTPGARNVDLQYTDPAYLKGRVITLVALVGSLLAIIVGILGTTRRGRPSAVALTPEPSVPTT